MFRVILIILAAVTVPVLALAAEWYEEDFNPNPMVDDIVLPMPCGGSMVFRKVETNLFSDPGAGMYADRAIRLGWDGARSSAYREGEWKSFVAGGLMDESSRYYLIGKYELTQDQVNALFTPDCSDDDVDFGAPHTGMTWFDAINLSHLYSVWLHENATDDLPVSVGTTAYVRPPTEAEWEFAARGGLQVSDSERRNERFPMEAPLQDYAFYSGDGVSNGDLQYIGKRRANPLGLFDVYGNAFEIVFDPFRLNKGGRMHGHFGAMTIKGGSIRSGAEEIRSGTRQEVPLYNAGVAGSVTRRADVGIRLVISGVSTGDQSHSDMLSSVWDDLVDSRAAIDVAQPPVQLLRQIADESEEQALRDRLNSIAADLENNLRERDELEVLALENQIRSGALMVSRLHSLALSIENMRQLRVHLEDRSPSNLPDETDDVRRERLRLVEQYDKNLEEFGQYAAIFADTFLQLIENYPREQVLELARGLRRQLTAQGRPRLSDHLSVLGRSLASYSDADGWDRTAQIRFAMEGASQGALSLSWLDDVLSQN